MPASRLLARRSRLTTTLIVLLGLFLTGTVIVLSTAKAYFSIDKSAYILPEELGTWEEIKWGSDADLPLGWASRYPWLWRLLHNHKGPVAAEAIEEAAAAAGQPLPVLDQDLVRPADPNSPPEKVPRIIHQTWKDEVLPPKWQAVRDECAKMHPDYEYMLWTDASSREFIAEHYSWFLPVFDSYPYAIQRADAIRYFVLHYYGGVYMDLDIGCRRRLDPLLRFEVILPVTRPVGVSNDLIFAAKGHPFMDQVIHNLVTFNHRYLTHYPTVMFSTGPMFVSASYGLYVDAHGPASPSTSLEPDAGFSGVRVLPKPLYGKNAPLSEVPDAFFKHYYGSSWHAGDAGFLIFLRDHGRFLMFIGACVVAYGAFKTIVPRLMFSMKKGEHRRSASRSSRSHRRSGQWVGLPIRTAAAASSSSSSQRRSNLVAMRDCAQTPDTHLGGNQGHAKPRGPPDSPTTATGAARSGALSVAAPRPQRLSLPFFELDETDGEPSSDQSSEQSRPSNDEPAGLLSWAGLGPAPLHHSDSSTSSSLSDAGPAVPRGWSRASGVLLLPAYFLSRIGSPALGFGSNSGSGAERDTEAATGDLPSHHSPADSWSSSQRGGMATAPPSPSKSPSVLDRAAQLLPKGWRGPVGGRGRTPVPDLELDNVHIDDEGERTPLVGAGGHTSFVDAGRRMSNFSTASSSTSAWFDDAMSRASSSMGDSGGVATAGQSSLRPVVGHDGFLTPAAAAGPVPGSSEHHRTPPPPYDGAAGRDGQSWVDGDKKAER